MPNTTILVVYDEAIIRESIALGLESISGWKVLQADTGIAGLKAAKKEQPDLILLDVTLPEMDGVTALRELQQDDDTRHIPVIMLTGCSGEADRRIYGEIGATWLIAKPFDLFQLPHLVSTVLGWDT